MSSPTRTSVPSSTSGSRPLPSWASEKFYSVRLPPRAGWSRPSTRRSTRTRSPYLTSTCALDLLLLRGPTAPRRTTMTAKRARTLDAPTVSSPASPSCPSDSVSATPALTTRSSPPPRPSRWRPWRACSLTPSPRTRSSLLSRNPTLPLTLSTSSRSPTLETWTLMRSSLVLSPPLEPERMVFLSSPSSALSEFSLRRASPLRSLFTPASPTSLSSTSLEPGLPRMESTPSASGLRRLSPAAEVSSSTPSVPLSNKTKLSSNKQQQ
mmetsp:Transcript_1149/g.1939  ORF Transcript_1149/g.1939 Transcript_1149/m.1939 type:complete len:266 (-) Transcript_1149:18-815(-)